jgi:hypothetical protein
VSKRTQDIGVAKAWKARHTSYYYDLERGVEVSNARSLGVNTEPAGHNSVERQASFCVLLLNILAKK